MLSYTALHDLLYSVHERFTYVGDMEQFDTPEYWMSFDEIAEGDFSGDCDDFAQACRKELASIGEESRLATVGVNSPDSMNHCICIYDNWILDNRFEFPMRKADVPDYTFFSISGFNPNEPWHELS